ncbi:hypothetical protein B0T20DRAFT_497327 [Sordaria brevicollis]|uniref:CorA-like transporter domain-containing protein n=1 Tax=Sordaria brevicollis TaxID=83679 RepID=A0AAE0UCL9_SORBR|nr:hypothetical protein B0T20DRAFT_497327 [Sordaria brevicollis]
MNCWKDESYRLSDGFGHILNSVHDWSCHDYYTNAAREKTFKEKSSIKVLFQPLFNNHGIFLDHVDSGFSEDQSTESGASDTASLDTNTEKLPLDCHTAGGLSSATVQDKDQLMELMRTKTDFRVFFLSQKNSFRRLSITESLFEYLVEVNRIYPRILEVLNGFSDKRVETEVGPPACAFTVSRPATGQPFPGLMEEHSDSDPIFECSYVLRFVERRDGKASDVWSLRQTGFYHQYNRRGIQVSKSRATSTWVLMGCSDIPRAIMEQYCRKNQRTVANSNPLELHVIFLDMAISTWRPNMIDIEKRSKKAAVAETHDDFLSLSDEQKLHSLELKLLDMILCMDSTSHTIGQLKEMYNQYLWATGSANMGDLRCMCATQTDGILLALRQQAAEVGYIRKKAEALVAKCRESRNLEDQQDKGDEESNPLMSTRQTSRFLELQTTLALKNIQIDTQEESKSMHDLAKKGHSESKSLKALSLMTAFYLPTTVIMSFYSTQFVRYDDGAGEVQYARDWWMLPALSMPFTLLTFVAWYLLSQKWSRKYRDGKRLGEGQARKIQDVEMGKV